MADQKDLDIIKEINVALEKQLQFDIKRARLKGEELSSLERQVVQLRAKEALQNNLTELLEADAEHRAKASEFMLADLDREKRRGILTSENYEAQKKLITEIGNKETVMSTKRLASLKKELKAQDARNKSQDKFVKSLVAGEKAGEGLANILQKTIGLSQQQETITGELLKSVNLYGKNFKEVFGGLGKVASSFGSSMKKSLSFGNIIGGLFSQQVQSQVLFNELQTGFSGATGAGLEYSKVIEGAARSGLAFGTSLAGSAEATSALYTEFARFSTLSTESQVSIVGLTDKLSNVGVSASTTASNFNFLVSELGKSVPQASKILQEFAETGRDIGVAPAELAESFKQLQPRLSQFGAKAPAIFDKTARMAKKLGMNVSELGSDLFSLSDRLSTFEGAASAVADMNLVLGGSFINAFDLAMAAEGGPEAQLEMLRQAMANSGKTIEQMGFHERGLLEQGLGLDSGKLKAFLEGDMTTAKGEGKGKAKLDKMSQDSTSIMKQASETRLQATRNLSGLNNEFMDGKAKVAEFIDSLGGGAALQTISAVFAGLSGVISILSSLAGAKALGGIFKGGGGAGGGMLGKMMLGGKGLMGKAAGGIGSLLLGKGGFDIALDAADTMGGLSGKVASKGAAQVGSKAAAPIAAKAGGKALAKAVPGLGLLLSAGFAIDRAMDGDLFGAGAEVLSGVASLVPVVGTAASLAISGGLAAKDMGAFDSEVPSANAGGVNRPATSAAAGQDPAQKLLTQMVRLTNAMDRQTAATNTGQPVKVELFLDSAGTNKIAETTINYVNKNYGMGSNARVPA
tara:strand:+ start:3574 stop:5979 length:2406 start_codon:yes stop_codon:yes gene_type:complete